MNGFLKRELWGLSPTAVQPGASPGRAEDFTAFMRMMFAAASSSEAFPPASTPAAPAQPPAIEDKPAAQEEPKPSIKTIHLTAIEPGQVLEVDGSPSFFGFGRQWGYSCPSHCKLRS